MNEIIKSVLESKKQLNKTQIGIIENMLLNAIGDKKREISNAAEENLNAKFASKILSAVSKFNKEISSIDAAAKKEYKGSYISISSTYSNDKEKGIFVKADIGINFRGGFDDKHPIEKAEQETKNLILALQLGQDVKENISSIIETINKIN